MMAKNPQTGKIQYFVDKCLPFGASISCSHFQRFSNCIEFIFRKRTGKKANNYLDDFFFAALLAVLCNNQVQKFLNLYDEIGFPVVLEKMVWATQIIVFLGILIDTINQTISIPSEKLKKAVDLLN